MYDCVYVYMNTSIFIIIKTKQPQNALRLNALWHLFTVRV